MPGENEADKPKEDILSKMMEEVRSTEIEHLTDDKFPMVIQKRGDIKCNFRCLTGDLKKLMHPVSVRPCGSGEKTYLGFYLGDYTRSFDFLRVKEPSWPDFKLCLFSLNNPAIFVPDLGMIVWGDESWWGFIKNEEQLRKITNNDIENVWYVKALKALVEMESNPLDEVLKEEPVSEKKP